MNDPCKSPSPAPARRRRSRAWGPVAAAFALASLAFGCGDDDGGEGPPSLPVACATDDGCATDERCVRGACLARCGGDPTRFDEAVAAGVTFLANVCRSATAFDTSPTGDVLEVAFSGAVGTVRRFAGDAGNGPPDAVDTGVSIDVSDATTGGDLFVSPFVAEAPGGEAFAVGFTELGDGVPGAIGVAGPAGDTTTYVAPGNFDATWLDDTTLLVNGLGLGAVPGEGQGLYAIDVGTGALRRLIGGPGGASGAVTVSDDGLVLYGFLDEAFVDAIAATTVADVRDVLADPDAEPIALADDPRLTIASGKSDFVLLDGVDLVVETGFTPDFSGTLLSVRTVSGRDAGSFALGDSVPLAAPTDAGTIIFGAEGLEGDRALLVHVDGLLLVSLGGLVGD